MPYSASRFPLRLMHLGVLALVIWFSVMAIRSRPHSRLIGQAKVNAGTTLSLHDDDTAVKKTALSSETGIGPITSHRSWDMDLTLDPSIRPPGWPWILHEGKHPGEGYELHWLPEQQVLQVQRARPGSFLLGSCRLGAMPNQVSFQRRGGQLIVIADDAQVLRCLDPDGPPHDTPQAWGCSTSGTLGDATLTVQAVELAVPRWGAAGAEIVTANDELPAADGPFLAVRGALQAGGTPTQIAWAFGLAQEQLGSRRSVRDEEQPGRGLTPPDRARMRLWLALARIRWQLTFPDTGDETAFRLVEEDVDTLFTVTDHDETLRHGAAAPELVGILLSLTEPFAQRACAIPSAAITDQPDLVNERIFDYRQRWIDLLGRVIARIDTLASSNLAADDVAQVRLLLHATGCLAHGDIATAQVPSISSTSTGWLSVPLPLALDAPQWLAGRWRAFSGGDPRMDSFPPLAGNQGPAAAAITYLANYVDLDPVPAIGLRTRILDYFAQRRELMPLGHESETRRADLEDRALRACEEPSVPPRERLLARALVILALSGDRQRSLLTPLREALISSDLVRTDPLAYALDQLLEHRFGPKIAENITRSNGFYQLSSNARITRFFSEYQVLMDGSAAATARIWRVRMPHAQALAVALIMQEVAGREPAWGLLERVPGFTLPLPLLARVWAPTAAGGIPAPLPADGSVAP